ncbi:ABC transporter ATP-binding protein [Acidaminobacter hydrogenoformans]|uniref:ATP-binding cassette, subfamily B n=1 Tax=Acidaminobacter hydrogenoformans DSM 2784 TaxID=1120920 RepID=A0A1G5RZ90_9FIRM|nr:ABC transporter ATP-binding protein [Acidaminobacter hydrogenoformans]SCZ78629.1 ATP-binding cassette, subfamily B [Acidaminobacter hydrogenoformans DSM 2784]
MPSGALLKHLKPFLKRKRWHLLGGVIILIIIDLLQLITPRLIGALADLLAQKTATRSDILETIGLILGIAVLVATGRYFWRILIIGTAREAEYWLRNRLYAHVQTLRTDYFNVNKVGDVMALATNDVVSVSHAMGIGTVMLVDAVFITIMTLIFMLFTADLQLTLIALLPMPVIATLVLYGGRLMRKRFKRVQEAFSDMTDLTQETFSGIRIVKTYTREPFQRERFKTSNDLNYKENMSLVKLWGGLFPLVRTIGSVSLVLTLLFGGRAVIDGRISVGAFVAFISYVGMLSWPMMALGWVVNVLQRGSASLSRLNEVFDLKPSYTYGTLEPPKATHDHAPLIELRDLTFTYPGQKTPALKHLTLTIQKGEKVALIGRTGAGKTTLLQLLTKAWASANGQIYLDGYDLNQLSARAIKDRFAVVPQDNFLFSKTIEDNIRFYHTPSENTAGEKASSTQRTLPTVTVTTTPEIVHPETIGKNGITKPTLSIQSAAQAACVHDEILSFPEGYDTLLGERGVNLSGGQKQRVSIARALFRDADILILDDALSAVDTKTEETILRHLNEALADKTALIVSHRISTVKDCDCIYVLTDGEITESGTHAELLDLGGYYRDLYNRQQLEDKLGSGTGAAAGDTGITTAEEVRP